MIVQINQLFINTDNITTISPYETTLKVEGENSVSTVLELGIVINGIKYTLYTVDVTDIELVSKTSQKVNNIVNTIVNMLVTPVQRLKLGDEND